MNLLMITPRVDMEHDVFGFIHTWIDWISKRVDRLDVITFKKGKTYLRDNVKVYSAYSSSQPGKLIKLNRLLLKLVPRADVVFTHMYPWLPIVAAPYAKVFGKPLMMFRAHGHVNWKLRISLMLVDRAITSSKKGFRIESDKLTAIGQGIDIQKFRPSTDTDNNTYDSFRIVSSGRVGRAKGYDMLIKAMDILINDRKKSVVLTIIGPFHDQDYYMMLRKLVDEKGLKEYVEFTGSVPFEEIERYYRQSDIYASASTTGSLDKTTLEAMASALPVVVCNEAFLDLFDEEMKKKCFFRKRDHHELADKIGHFMENDEKDLRKRLRNIVVENHNVDSLAEKLVDVFEGVRK